MRRRPGLDHARPTLRTRVFRADRDDYLVARRNLVKPLRPIFADPDHVAATQGQTMLSGDLMRWTASAPGIAMCQSVAVESHMRESRPPHQVTGSITRSTRGRLWGSARALRSLRGALFSGSTALPRSFPRRRRSAPAFRQWPSPGPPAPVPSTSDRAFPISARTSCGGSPEPGSQTSRSVPSTR